MKTIINQEICIGCGTCVALCPTYYRMNDTDTKAEVQQPSTEGDTSLLQESITLCPVGAINEHSTSLVPSHGTSSNNMQ